MANVIVCRLLVALAAVSQIPTAPGSGQIVGRVIDAGTGVPVAGVQVRLVPRLRDAAQPPALQLPPFSETNADGVFEIGGVPNGRWAILATRDGYVPLTAETMPVVDAVAGRRVVVPDIRLDRGGAISGRLRDTTSNPMSGVVVTAVRLRRLSDGTVQLYGSSPSERTNDLGEFRLSGLTPGTHFLVARQPSRPIIGGTAPPPAPSTYVTTFYPGTTDAAFATPVSVTRGGTTSTNDFWMQTAPTYQVTGVAVDSAGRPVAGAIVGLSERAPMGATLQSGPTLSDGSFRIVNVPPGTYAITAGVPVVRQNDSGGISRSLALRFGIPTRPGAAPEVVVQGGDLPGLRVVVRQLQSTEAPPSVE